MVQAHLAAKAHQFGAIVLRHQAESFIAADECGSQIACLQVKFGMHIIANCLTAFDLWKCNHGAGHTPSQTCVMWSASILNPRAYESWQLRQSLAHPPSSCVAAHLAKPAALPLSQEAQRRLQAARREASSGKVHAELSARLAELETETGAALAKAERENGGVYLQASSDRNLEHPCVRVMWRRIGCTPHRPCEPPCRQRHYVCTLWPCQTAQGAERTSVSFGQQVVLTMQLQKASRLSPEARPAACRGAVVWVHV